ncbi:unnamed protein product [Periconia digitata]|uniref:Uncharacterized protein n=1 Tax=Periconia digitata TaxID=1303443 RepID=A0A9W4UGT5_9PLEO|nr:unnamed protein product [Periconia digitata]
MPRFPAQRAHAHAHASPPARVPRVDPAAAAACLLAYLLAFTCLRRRLVSKLTTACVVCFRRPYQQQGNITPSFSRLLPFLRSTQPTLEWIQSSLRFPLSYITLRLSLRLPNF